LQWQPLLWRATPSSSPPVPSEAIFGRKACGLRSSVASTASCRLASCALLLQQLVQLQPLQ